jgi:hypothetical protein
MKTAGLLVIVALSSIPGWAGGSCTDPNGCATVDKSAMSIDPPKPKPDCLDGTYYDDGKLESSLSPNVLLFRDDLVMLFEAAQYPTKLQKVCLQWRRLGLDNAIFFDLHVWAADGPNGGPGSLVADLRSLFSSKIGKPKFFSYDVQAYNVVIEGPVYIGPSWDPLNPFRVYLGMDTGPKTPRRRGYYGTGNGAHEPSSDLGVVGSYRALGIRAVFGPP